MSLPQIIAAGRPGAAVTRKSGDLPQQSPCRGAGRVRSTESSGEVVFDTVCAGKIPADILDFQPAMRGHRRATRMIRASAPVYDHDRPCGVLHMLRAPENRARRDMGRRAQ